MFGQRNSTVPSWDWQVVDGSLEKKSKDTKQDIIDLSPEIEIMSPHQQPATIEVQVTLEHSLQYCAQFGFNWHKSWKLPFILYQLQLTDPQNGQNMMCPYNLKCEIYSVQQSHDENRFIDVGLEGQRLVLPAYGQNTFNSIKFENTTFSLQGSKIYLMLHFYIEEKLRQLTFKTLVSPPIYVDSRKSQREKKFNQKEVVDYSYPFLPSKLDQTFTKRENKRCSKVKSVIQDDFLGILNYFTAPNLRNKVKHPLFLMMYFPSTTCIFYNREKISSFTKPEELILQFQIALQNNGQIIENKNQKLSQIKAYQFCILFQPTDANTKDKKRMMDYLEIYQGKLISVTDDESLLTKNQFVNFYDNCFDVNNLRKIYQKIFTQLLEPFKKKHSSNKGGKNKHTEESNLSQEQSESDQESKSEDDDEDDQDNEEDDQEKECDDENDNDEQDEPEENHYSDEKESQKGIRLRNQRIIKKIPDHPQTDSTSSQKVPNAQLILAQQRKYAHRGSTQYEVDEHQEDNNNISYEQIQKKNCPNQEFAQYAPVKETNPHNLMVSKSKSEINDFSVNTPAKEYYSQALNQEMSYLQHPNYQRQMIDHETRKQEYIIFHYYALQEQKQRQMQMKQNMMNCMIYNQQIHAPVQMTPQSYQMPFYNHPPQPNMQYTPYPISATPNGPHQPHNDHKFILPQLESDIPYYPQNQQKFLHQPYFNNQNYNIMNENHNIQKRF